MSISNSLFSSSLGWFRLVALAEGVSYLVLLFVAMPLKYFANKPEPVKYIGWLHGFLFMAFGLLLIMVWSQYNWRFKKVLMAFVAALLPFGTFYLDRKIKEEYFSGQDL